MTTCLSKFKFVLILLFLILFIGSEVFAQKNNVTISGNINNQHRYGNVANEFSFQYRDIVTFKPIIIPIKKDSLGNFSVSFLINGPQEISFKPAKQTKNGISYNSGVTEFFFYVLPGQKLIINYQASADFTIRKVEFSGKDAAINKINRKHYENSKQDNVLYQINWPSKEIDSGSVEGLKKYLSAKLAEGLAANKKYFKEVRSKEANKKFADGSLISKKDRFQTISNMTFVEKQAEWSLRYAAANKFVMALVAQSKNYDIKQLDFLAQLNIKVNNPDAYGNDMYKIFIFDYFLLLGRAAEEKKGDILISNDMMAPYLLKNHPELAAEDKALAKKMLDTVNKPSEEESNRFMKEFTKPYFDEYVASSRNNIPEFDYALTVNDPFLRDLFATTALYDKIDQNRIDYLKPNLAVYGGKVRNGTMKNNFLAYYHQIIDKRYNSKFPAKAKLYGSGESGNDDVLRKIRENYRGKMVYVDVWATWCVPCLAAMEESQKLRDKLAGKDVVFVYLCIDSTPKLWESLIAANNIEGENYFLNYTQSNTLKKELNVKSIPRYLLIDKDGTIAKANAGRPGDDETIDSINSLLLK